MRKTIYSILALGLVIGSTLTSCSAEDRNSDFANNAENQSVLSKSDVINAPLAKQLQYKKYYLQKAGKVIRELGISTDDLVQLSIQSEAKGQQEKTFLLKDVVTLAKSRKQNITTDLSKTINQLNNAFKGIDGRDYEISIYIPFAEKLETFRKGTSNKAANNDIFIFEGEEKSEQQYFEGYILNEDGNYVSYEQLINEQMAEELGTQGKNVAVIGIQDVQIITSPQGPATTNKKSFRLGNTVIKQHKESWVAGKSDIAIQMYKYENGTLNKINLINSNTFGENEYIFRQFSRKEIKDQTTVNLEYLPLVADIDVTASVYNNSRFPYVIYEADSWPVTKREIKFTLPNGQTQKITFGSSDMEYYHSNYHDVKITPYNDNAGIRFNTLFK